MFESCSRILVSCPGKEFFPTSCSDWSLHSSRRREKSWRKLGWQKEPTTGLLPYRADKGKGWHWLALLSTTRICCCSTNRWDRWMRSHASKCSNSLKTFGG